MIFDSILKYLAYLVSIAINGAAGGNTLVVLLFVLIIMAMVMWSLNFTLPSAALVVVFALGILSISLNAGQFGSLNVGLAWVLFGTSLFFGGWMMWNLLSRRAT